jgi:hypothetical protein
MRRRRLAAGFGFSEEIARTMLFLASDGGSTGSLTGAPIYRG